jgi:hypothetical protein
MWNHVKWPKGVSWAPKNGIWLKKCGSNVADHVHKNFSQRKWKLTTQDANFNNQRGSKPSPDRSDERFELVAGRSGSWDPYIWYIKVSFKLPIQPGINLVQQVVFSEAIPNISRFNQQLAELIPLVQKFSSPKASGGPRKKECSRRACRVCPSLSRANLGHRKKLIWKENCFRLSSCMGYGI